MAIWTGDLTEEQKTAIEYYISKIKNCKKLQEHSESSAEMERLDDEIHELESRLHIAYDARDIYNSMLIRAHEAVNSVEEWAKEWGFNK